MCLDLDCVFIGVPVFVEAAFDDIINVFLVQKYTYFKNESNSLKGKTFFPLFSSLL